MSWSWRGAALAGRQAGRLSCHSCFTLQHLSVWPVGGSSWTHTLPLQPPLPSTNPLHCIPCTCPEPPAPLAPCLGTSLCFLHSFPLSLSCFLDLFPPLSSCFLDLFPPLSFLLSCPLSLALSLSLCISICILLNSLYLSFSPSPPPLSFSPPFIRGIIHHIPIHLSS